MSTNTLMYKINLSLIVTCISLNGTTCAISTYLVHAWKDVRVIMKYCIKVCTSQRRYYSLATTLLLSKVRKISTRYSSIKHFIDKLF